MRVLLISAFIISLIMIFKDITSVNFTWRRTHIFPIILGITTFLPLLQALVNFLSSDLNLLKTFLINLEEALYMDHFEEVCAIRCANGTNKYCNQSSYRHTEHNGGEVLVLSQTGDIKGIELRYRSRQTKIIDINKVYKETYYPENVVIEVDCFSFSKLIELEREKSGGILNNLVLESDSEKVLKTTNKGIIGLFGKRDSAFVDFMSHFKNFVKRDFLSDLPYIINLNEDIKTLEDLKFIVTNPNDRFQRPLYVKVTEMSYLINIEKGVVKSFTIKDERTKGRENLNKLKSSEYHKSLESSLAGESSVQNVDNVVEWNTKMIVIMIWDSIIMTFFVVQIPFQIAGMFLRLMFNLLIKLVGFRGEIGTVIFKQHLGYCKSIVRLLKVPGKYYYKEIYVDREIKWEDDSRSKIDVEDGGDIEAGGVGSDLTETEEILGKCRNLVRFVKLNKKIGSLDIMLTSDKIRTFNKGYLVWEMKFKYNFQMLSKICYAFNFWSENKEKGVLSQDEGYFERRGAKVLHCLKIKELISMILKGEKLQLIKTVLESGKYYVEGVSKDSSIEIIEKLAEKLLLKENKDILYYIMSKSLGIESEFQPGSDGNDNKEMFFKIIVELLMTSSGAKILSLVGPSGMQKDNREGQQQQRKITRLGIKKLIVNVDYFFNLIGYGSITNKDLKLKVNRDVVEKCRKAVRLWSDNEDPFLYKKTHGFRDFKEMILNDPKLRGGSISQLLDFKVREIIEYRPDLTPQRVGGLNGRLILKGNMNPKIQNLSEPKETRNRLGGGNEISADVEERILGKYKAVKVRPELGKEKMKGKEKRRGQWGESEGYKPEEMSRILQELNDERSKHQDYRVERYKRALISTVKEKKEEILMSESMCEDEKGRRTKADLLEDYFGIVLNLKIGDEEERSWGKKEKRGKVRGKSRGANVNLNVGFEHQKHDAKAEGKHLNKKMKAESVKDKKRWHARNLMSNKVSRCLNLIKSKSVESLAKGNRYFPLYKLREERDTKKEKEEEEEKTRKEKEERKEEEIKKEEEAAERRKEGRIEMENKKRERIRLLEERLELQRLKEKEEQEKIERENREKIEKKEEMEREKILAKEQKKKIKEEESRQRAAKQLELRRRSIERLTREGKEINEFTIRETTKDIKWEEKMAATKEKERLMKEAKEEEERISEQMRKERRMKLKEADLNSGKTKKNKKDRKGGEPSSSK